jgi:hypothetical protein
MTETITITEQDLEERSSHSFVAGQHSTMELVVQLLQGRAGELFSLGKDDLAREVRDLARKFEKRQDEFSRELDQHIQRNIRGKP